MPRTLLASRVDVTVSGGGEIHVFCEFYILGYEMDKKYHAIMPVSINIMGEKNTQGSNQ